MIYASVGAAAEKEATVRLEVVDEVGEPVPNADMTIVFGGYQWQQDVKVSMMTNAQGILVAKGWPKAEYMADVKVTSEASGYYTSSTKAGSATKVDFDLNLLIRKKEDPIAMYAKKVELELPEQRKEIGFDFEKGDWVAPYGKGEVADCTFIGEKAYEDWDNYRTTAVMSFPGKEAGMQPDVPANEGRFKQSSFKTSRIAPLDGYQPIHKFIRVKKNKFRDGSTKEANYIFRSRVVLDEEGEIESCHYGKMIDAVSVATKSALPDTNPIVSFTYYFNPTPNDRNLEFEPKLNLFSDLDWNEEVSAP